MRLAISNIAWAEKDDALVYGLMRKYGYEGLEIAPTRIFADAPYEKLKEIAKWSFDLKEKYGLVVPSMQSIWFGREEKLFGSEEERKVLFDYTQKAIDFAVIINCKNLVFGCPKNRYIPDGVNPEVAVPFFRKLGDYAASKGIVVAIEANPPIYNTNYINGTKEALKLIEKVDSPGFMLNLDVGTMIQNEESMLEIEGNVKLINHVHISEPGLKVIERRTLHQDLLRVLKEGGYNGFISIEMGRVDSLLLLEEKLKYVRDVYQ